MSFFDTFCEMLVILFGMAVGYAAHRMGILGGEIDQKLSKLVLNFTLPAMIVGSVAGGSNLPGTEEILAVLKIAVFFYGIEFLLVPIIPRLLGGTPGQKGVWRYTVAFPNMAFIGYPVVMKLFGADMLFYAVVLTMPFNVINYSLGPLMLAGAKRFHWKQLLSPCIISAVLSLILALCGIQLPPLVGEALNFVGDVSIPMALLIVGSLLAGMSMKQAFTSIRPWILAAIRLVAMPTLLFLILRGMEIAPTLLGVAVVEMAMPTALNGSMLCLEYGGDTECMAQITLLTTLAAIVTIPLVAMVLL